MNLADFTTVMGSFHDEEKELVELRHLVAPEDLAKDIKRSIKKIRQNKASGRDSVQNEMRKKNAVVITTLLAETWALICRERKYPEEWK